MKQGNHLIYQWLKCAILLFLFPLALSGFPLRKSLLAISQHDTTCKVWVIFTDKPHASYKANITERAKLRRKRNGVSTETSADLPISPSYLLKITQHGGIVSKTFKWANAASIHIAAKKLPELAALPFVKDIVGVRTFISKTPLPGKNRIAKTTTTTLSNIYGESYAQLSTLNVPLAHYILRKTTSTPPGDGILIGVFDSGFRTNHTCYSYFNTHNLRMASQDFIDKDNTVFDPDSVAKNPIHPYYHNDEHGSMTLGQIAGHDSSHFVGTAWGARFILARTEDTKYDSLIKEEVERHYEEDNWAAAVVWAESLGVDIVSSSLGYRDGFTFPDTSYTYHDLDGKTTIISKAAKMAALYGVIIVNSMGNEGNSPGSLNAPADVAEVISVGAIDYSLSIAAFSSTGPTADGRIKPDCVAPGVNIVVPDVYSTNNFPYSSSSGTSFSAPMIAGMCALILQAHKEDSASTIRKRLYESCSFAPLQTNIDNFYGNGIPDALLAILPYNQTYVMVDDTFGNVVYGAQIQSKTTQTLFTSDSIGLTIVTLPTVLPDTLSVSHPLYQPYQFVLTSRKQKTSIVLKPKNLLTLLLQDTLGKPLSGKIAWKSNAGSTYTLLATDTNGIARIANVAATQIEVYGEAAGYIGSSHYAINFATTTSLTITLKPRPASAFVLYPNIIDINKKHQHLTIEFTANSDEPRSYSQLFSCAIRSIDGMLVWTNSSYLAENKPVVLQWPARRTTVAPGVYFFIINYAGKIFKQKFMVKG